ncbi:MAG: hypothetical protein JXO51_03420 [Candidatus Aminicenantes bacterium]|nr:hypothetical protein [Candidatus Aminicenantes bacterium]
MTWKRMMGVIGAVMLLALAIMFFFLSRLDIPSSEIEVMGVRSLFPAGRYTAVAGAENGWQGFAFSGHFRLFRRPSPQAEEDFAALKRKNFSEAPLQADLDLFGGGICVMRKAAKSYRLFCIFYKGEVNYWADMRSSGTLDFAFRAFERFILNLEIDGARPLPVVAGQIASLRKRISPLLMQSPAQLLVLMAAIFLAIMGITWAANRFSGSCPRHAAPGADCTPGATLVASGFGRRKVTACCLCLEGDFLVIYRFRRPYMKIDLRRERQDIAWEKAALRYKNVRLRMDYEAFEKWRLRLMG